MKINAVFLIIAAYVIIVCATLQWGAPNQFHPFPYHMDEWHQLQAVRATIKFGTPNTAGAANGTMLHFILSGLYLVPPTLIQYIDPSSIKIDDFQLRERIFQLLRINTLIYGVLSLFVFYKITKLLKVSSTVVLILFASAPIWVTLSGYFKYDIALIFWLLLSIWFFFRFAKNPTNRNFVLAAIPASLTVAVKISAIPLLIIYIISYFWFSQKWKKNIKYLFIGIGVFLGCLILFGMPDTLYGKGNLYDYFYVNTISGPQNMDIFNLGMQPLLYVFIFQYPILFGHGLITAFLLSIVYLGVIFYRNRKTLRIEAFLFFSFIIFVISLLPLKLYGGGNRSLVLLPFIVLIIGMAWESVIKIRQIKYWAIGFLTIIVTVQFYEVFSWVHMRYVPSPQSIASEWIKQNIPAKTTIGVENIPIYQNLPDLVEKEFYFAQYTVKNSNRYTYKVIDAKQKDLPNTIVITNGDVDSQYFKNVPKKALVERLKREGYRKKIEFSPDLRYFKLFGNEREYYFSWLLAAPLTTAIYIK